MLGSETIKVYQPNETTDADGSIAVEYELDPSNAILVSTLTGCAVQPFLLADKLQQEDNISRFNASTTFRVFAPGHPEIHYDQWIEWKGDIYEVYGFPGYWNDLEGSSDIQHVEFLIRLRRG